MGYTFYVSHVESLKKKKSCKTTIDNGSLVREEIHAYTKFIYILELDNI